MHKFKIGIFVGLIILGACSRQSQTPVNKEALFTGKGCGRGISIRPAVTTMGVDILIDGQFFATVYATGNQHGVTIYSKEKEVFWMNFNNGEYMPFDVRRVLDTPAGKALVVYGPEGSVVKSVPMK